MLITFRMHSE